MYNVLSFLFVTWLAVLPLGFTAGQGGELGPSLDPGGMELGPALDPAGNTVATEDGGELGPALDPTG